MAIDPKDALSSEDSSMTLLTPICYVTYGKGT